MKDTNLYVREAGTATLIPLTILPPELSPGIYKILLKATSYLDFDKQYEIIIGDTIKDLDNEALSNPMTISYRTKKIEEVGALSDTRIIDSVIDTTKKRLYALDNWMGFRIIDTTDPKNPKIAAKRDMGMGAGGISTPEGIAVTDICDSAVIVGYSGQAATSYIWLVNKNENDMNPCDIPLPPTDPGTKDRLAMPGSNILNSWAQQNTYVPIYGGYGYTYTNIGLSGYDTNDGVAYKVAMANNKAYVASLFLGVQVVDLSKALMPNNLGNPVLSTIETRQAAIDTFPRDIKALHASSPSAKIITITNEALIGIDPISDSIMWAYDLSSYGSFFRMEIAEDVYYTDAAGVQQTMDIAFVTTSHTKKLLIIDITNTPQIIKEMTFTDAVFRVHYNKEHKLLFIQVGSNLLVYELNSMLSSNLQGEPRQIGMYEGGGWANDIISDGNYLYMGEWGNLRVVQYDPDWGMELEKVDEEFLKDGKSTALIPASDYYPRLEEKDIWIKVMDSACDLGIIGSLLGKTKEACLQEYNFAQGVEPARPVKVTVMRNHEETKIPQGCEINGVNADGKYSADGGSEMELNKARAKFKIKCANTIKDGEIAVVFKRENNRNETWPNDSKNLQAKVVFRIRSNANVRFAEVLEGSAVYVYDENTESKTSWSAISQTPTNETRGLDYVQELFNQVVPRKRKGYDNYDSVIPIDNNYKLIEENGIYDNAVYNAVLDFKQHFKIGINRKVGTYTLENKYSSDDETSQTFRKLMKDYGKRQEGNPWLIGDNTTNTWRHKVIDKETLVGLNGYQSTDTEVSLITSAVTGNVVVNTGLYELYENVVRKFVNKMIEEGEKYAGMSGTPVPIDNWVARTGEGAGVHGAGMSYCFGCKQTIEDFNKFVVSTAPPKPPKTKEVGGKKVIDVHSVPEAYKGNINEQNNQPDTGVAVGTRRWAGLINVEQKEAANGNRYDAFDHWTGIDCSGFIQRVVTAGKQAAPTVKVEIRDLKGTDADNNTLDDDALGSWEFLDNANKAYIFAWDAEDPVPTLKWIHKGDIIEYEGHNSTVYSDRPSCTTDNDGKTTCTYEIIHAYGWETYAKKNPTTGKRGKPQFSRKVLVTGEDIVAAPTGFGRIKLWD